MNKKLLFLAIIFVSHGLTAQTNLSGFYPNSNVSGLRFGTEVAMHDNTIVVASESSTLPLTVGMVYVFSKENQTITQENVFYPDDATFSDQYGKSISVSDEFIVVGSPMHDTGFTNDGAVYVYRKVNTEWSFFQKITPNDAVSDKQFGSFVKIQENSMFIVAPNDVNVDGIGAVYVYTFNGTEWIFSQKLTVPNTMHLGEKIEIKDDLLVVSESTFNQKKYHTFLYGSNWTYSDSSEEFGSLEQNIKDFSFDGQRLYLSSNELDSGTGSVNNIHIYNRINNSWVYETFLPMNFNDFIIGKISVSENNMLVGYDGYYLQMSRKFPVFYYKKIENEWQMQTSFYGEGQAGMDDRLGNSISLQGSHFVMGAYTEGPISNGKAYTFNLENLSTTSFEKSQISIFPNPTASTVTFQNNSINQPKNYELFSLTGKLLQSSTLDNTSISLENFQAGLYFLKISFDNGLFETHKIIKK